MEMGPSVMFIECCGGGKLDSLHPTNVLGNSYMHAGANAFISPSTYSAIGGYLEPRPKWPLLEDGVGLGITGYLKAVRDARQDKYPPMHFSTWVYEQSYLNLVNEDVSVGEALRNAKNDFLPDQIDASYLWTPPLSLPSDLPSEIKEEILSTASSGAGTVPVEKYCTIYQLNLQGDPAFNPYEPSNEGKYL